MRIGIIDVGGGMRGIYGAGIMDRFMEEGITFDYSIGVSAGSANLSSYLSRQTKRNYKYYAEYAFRWQYMSFRSWIVTGNYLNLEYIYGSPLTNSDGECPLDFKSLMDNPMEFEIVATDSATGKPVYFSKNDMKQDVLAMLICSCKKKKCVRHSNCEECRKHHADSKRQRPVACKRKHFRIKELLEKKFLDKKLWKCLVMIYIKLI